MGYSDHPNIFSYFKILRVAIDDEEIGMDIIKHGEAAYPVAAWREYQYRSGGDNTENVQIEINFLLFRLIFASNRFSLILLQNTRGWGADRGQQQQQGGEKVRQPGEHGEQRPGQPRRGRRQHQRGQQNRDGDQGREELVIRREMRLVKPERRIKL